MNQSLNIRSHITLQDGHRMPLLGLGVWDVRSGRETFQATLCAFKTGYRHVDTAQMYGNEKDVGDAFRASGLKREEVFLTSKLSNSEHDYDAALRAFDNSLKKMRLEFVDLFLIHWPSKGSNLQSWRALECIRQQGRSRSIGVSNFAPKHLSELLEKGNVRPVVNQIELNPFLQQQTIVSFCHQEKIHLTGYCPLARGHRFNEPGLRRIAEETKKSAAQVMIRWALQRGQTVIPKSVRPQRIEENADVFDFNLSPPQMEILNGLDQGFRICPDPLNL